MKAATLLNILSHLPAEAEVVLGEAESAILAEFRKLVPTHVADKVVPPAPPAAPVPPAE